MEQNKKEYQDVVEEMKEKIDNNLTISTKLSTEQLICKTPQESPSASLKCNKDVSMQSSNVIKEKPRINNIRPTSSIIYWANLQILFGILMIVAGGFVIYHKASLYQIGGGLWGGCLSTITGIIGIIAIARRLCPLKDDTQRITHTIYLTLSLICVAVSQLVLVLAATGLARDLSKRDLIKVENKEIRPVLDKDEDNVIIHDDYYVLLVNIGLIITSGLQFTCSVVSSYKSARKLCSCFQRDNDNNVKGDYTLNSHAIVSSWLGKHSPTTPFYVVAAPPSVGSRSKISANYPTSMYKMPPAMLTPPQMLRYPLIPAPLGPVPSPLITTSTNYGREKFDKLRSPSRDYAVPIYVPNKQKRSRSQSREPSITTEDVAKTYTGLDRVIAEEFIEICDSRNNSLCCNSSCQSCNKSDECNCQSNSTKSSMSDETFIHCTEAKCSKC